MGRVETCGNNWNIELGIKWDTGVKSGAIDQPIRLRHIKVPPIVLVTYITPLLEYFSLHFQSPLLDTCY